MTDTQGAFTMTDNELDAVYTALCNTMTELGEAHAALYLARFALLAIDALGDAPLALKLVDAARDGSLRRGSETDTLRAGG
jgi:hypothetical protein